MNELEKITEQEKKLKEKKKKALAKEYEKLGRTFYKQSKAKTFEGATNMLNHVPMFGKSEQSVGEQDLAELRHFANELKWQEQGQYWRTDNIKGLTNFLAKFRTEN